MHKNSPVLRQMLPENPGSAALQHQDGKHRGAIFTTPEPHGKWGMRPPMPKCYPARSKTEMLPQLKFISCTQQLHDYDQRSIAYTQTFNTQNTHSV